MQLFCEGARLALWLLASRINIQQFVKMERSYQDQTALALAVPVWESLCSPTRAAERVRMGSRK
jgi:hypothetical protein